MSISRRMTFLGLFAGVGVGLAICVGFSANPLSGRQKSRPKPATEQVANPSGAPTEAFRQPQAQPAHLLPARPIPSASGGPWVVEPYPALTQQIVPAMSADRLEQIREFVQQQLGAGAASGVPRGGSAPAGTNSAAANTVQPPAGTVAGQASPGPVAQTPKAKVNSEGDGRLSIHIPPGTDIREVLDLLGEQANLNMLVGKSVQGTTSATLNNVDIENALGAILKSTGYVAKREGEFVFIGTSDEFDSLEQAMDTINTRVYRPNYVTAAELQTLITPLLSETVGVVSVSTPAEAGIASDKTGAGADNFAGADVVLVRDYEAVLAQIDQLVREIDVRPLQVAIEAMILSVKLEDTDQFGVDFAILEKYAKVGWGFPVDTLTDLAFDAGGLKFGYLDGNVGAFLEALETIGDTNVIATPRLMVLNKHRAEIQIGEKQGYVSTTVTETSATQSVEFLDIGALLRLRPFISSDGNIRMEVHPELSDGSVIVDSGFTLPNKEVTEVTTNIMVRDGCTVIIGGLMREQLVNTTTQIPLLGSLPLLGFAFRNKKEEIERREVLVLITPRIVYEPGSCEEGDHAASEFHRRQSTYADKMTPFGKRSIGRRYFRLAQNAWAAGDQTTALRFAELAVHFNPLNRKAIDLRSDIWLGKRSGDHTLDAQPPTLAASGSIDGPTVPDWLLNDLQQEPVPVQVPQHPLDPGRPGSQTDLERPRRFQ